ncbi:MAG: tail fiber domain-containing protein, partial [Bacteroidota bacterium]
FKQGLEIIKQIKPVTYHYKDKFDLSSKEEYVGVIAQDLKEVAPFMVADMQIGEKGENYLSVDPSAFTYLLINSVQEQQLQIESLEEANTELTKKLNKQEQINNSLEDRLAKLEQMMQQLTEQSSNINTTSTKWSSAELKQNQPNPFTETTSIQYFIPKEVQQASLQITTLGGKVLKQLPIAERGYGRIVLEASSLSAGSYWYSLLLDGKTFEIKQMILTK